jgi:hypothetical protein
MRPAGGCVKSIEPAQHRSAELTQSRERQLHLSFHARNRGDSETRSLASGTPQQRRLSDTRLSTDDQDRALPPPDVLKQPVHDRALARPAPEPR